MKNGIVTTLLLLGVLWGGQCFALGVGASIGSGSETWTNTYTKKSTDREISNYGFVLDTSIARNRVFNYRLQVFTEDNKEKSTSGSYSGFSLTNDFGFSLVSTHSLRLWVGPRLKIAVLDNDDPTNFSSSVTGLLVGPVIGLNLNMPHLITFAFTVGKLKGSYAVDSCALTFCSDEDANGTFFNVALLFRFGRDN